MLLLHHATTAAILATPALPILSALGPSPALAEARPQENLPICRGGKRITCVVDGDTLWLDGEKIRVLGIDAPEVGNTAKCRKEVATGRVATERFRELVSAGSIELRRDGSDRYGRTLARVLVDGRDAGAQLVDEGLAVPYRGRTTAEPWCR